MKVLNFGSLNIDHVYQVEHFVQPGETIASRSYRRFAGGKGLNQSIALANGGAEVYHGGKIGADGRFLVELLQQHGVDTAFIQTGKEPTGHAIIQVDDVGENAIVISGGANACLDCTEIARTVSSFSSGDWLLLQNEVSDLGELMIRGKQQGMQVALNPAPFTPELVSLPLDLVDMFIVNETEALALTGRDDLETAIPYFAEHYPAAALICTMGAQGACYQWQGIRHRVAAPTVNVVDTTGAGDTFIGFFLASLFQGRPVEQALAMATAAAALCVTRPGAASAIPSCEEVEAYRNNHDRQR